MQIPVTNAKGTVIGVPSWKRSESHVDVRRHGLRGRLRRRSAFGSDRDARLYMRATHNTDIGAFVSRYTECQRHGEGHSLRTRPRLFLLARLFPRSGDISKRKRGRSDGRIDGTRESGRDERKSSAALKISPGDARAVSQREATHALRARRVNIPAVTVTRNNTTKTNNARLFAGSTCMHARVHTRTRNSCKFLWNFHETPARRERNARSSRGVEDCKRAAVCPWSGE